MERLAEFDGRSLSVLGEIEAQFGVHDGYLDDLIALAGDRNGAVSGGSTWLLKAYLERGGESSQSQTAEFAKQLSGITEWSAQLHVCQSVQYLRLDLGAAEILAVWLAPLLTHGRPFVRAWSLDALWRTARQHSAFSRQADAALAAAMLDPAASVRARARNLSGGSR